MKTKLKINLKILLNLILILLYTNTSFSITQITEINFQYPEYIEFYSDENILDNKPYNLSNSNSNNSTNINSKSFPYLYDETQEVAKAYDAACTPDCYLFNENLELVYRGQLDDSRPGNGIEVTGKDIRNAMDCLLESKVNNSPQKPSIGCNIKWKV